jgi:hypothetical protein
MVTEHKTDVQFIKDWCEERFVSYSMMLYLIQFRDDIIKEILFSLGLNPFVKYYSNLYKLMYEYDDNNPHLDITEVKQIKKCIYEGYKMNTATLNDNTYYSDRTHVPIKMKSYLIRESLKLDDFKQLKPKKIIYSSLMLSGSDKFAFNCGDCISIIDGFFDTDETFLIS